MVASSYGGAKVQFTPDSNIRSEPFVTANVFPWNGTACGEKNPSALLEEALRVGCCAVGRNVVVNAENHRLLIICLKL